MSCLIPDIFAYNAICRIEDLLGHATEYEIGIEASANMVL